MYQPAPQKAFTKPRIHVGGTQLKTVSEFPYLGSSISSDAKIDKDIEHRLSKANKAFAKLKQRLWTNSNIRRSTKIMVYKAIILPTLLYGAESWVLHKRHLHSLECFHQRCLRNLLNIRWYNRITNNEVFSRSKTTSIEATLHKTRLRWAGHVSRMPEHRLPKIAMFGELEQGKRNRGSPRKTYRAQLKNTLQACNLNLKNWTQNASDRGKWRKLIFASTSLAENRRRKAAGEKRLKRKSREETQ